MMLQTAAKLGTCGRGQLSVSPHKLDAKWDAPSVQQARPELDTMSCSSEKSYELLRSSLGFCMVVVF